VEAKAETLRKTTVADWARGRRVNCSAPVLNGRLDDHLVQGHVDQSVRCWPCGEDGGPSIRRLPWPAGSSAGGAAGSIAVNGVSLTVATLGADATMWRFPATR
jgi:riboflavin synthase